MDEERHQSFYAPKKLFKKRIRDSSESDDWSIFNSFVDSPSSFYANSYDDSIYSPALPVNGIDDNFHIPRAKLWNGYVNDNVERSPVYTNIKTLPNFNHRNGNRIHENNYIEDFHEKRVIQLDSIDASWVKKEVDDFHPFYGENSSNVNNFDTYNSVVPNHDKFRTPQFENRTELLDLSRSQQENRKEPTDLEILRSKVEDKESIFVQKFSLQESLPSHQKDEKQSCRPIPVSVLVKEKKVFSGPKPFSFRDLLRSTPTVHKNKSQPFRFSDIEKKGDSQEPFKFDLTQYKLEPMEAVSSAGQSLATDLSLHHLSPASKPFHNHVSSTNFNFDSNSNSRVSPPQTVNDDDLNNLIESEILKTSYPMDSVNVETVSSSVNKLKTDGSEVSPQKKHGKKWMKGDMVCQVCGDKAAGFYCGAFACEACKKFFMRSCRNDKTKYVCLRDKKCQITAESRVQCQYCRLQKCLSLNMYSPGSDVRKENVGDIPCRVCSAPSSGFHFGALTCEGCKGFFRRMAKERELGKYRCSKSGSCEINTSTRNLCKSCRYKKCVEAGMSIEGSRIGRQPNAVKYAISLEVKNQSGVKSESDEKMQFTLDDLNHAPAQPTEPLEIVETAQMKRPFVIQAEETEGPPPQKIVKQVVPKPVVNYEEMMKWIKECDKDLRVVQLPNKSEKNVMLISNVAELWEEIVKPFYYHSSVIIKFAKKCQPFRKLPLEDQVRMIQQALYPIVVLNHSRYYVLETKAYSYFGWSEAEREHIWKYFPFYRVLGEHFLNTGDNVKLLGLDDDEFTILSSLVLLNPDVPGLIDKEKVRQLQEEVLDFLENYLNVQYPEQPSRFGLILVRLSELNFYAYQHVEGIQQMLRVYPFLTMPQLYREMFINT